ncbi:polysaccharide deacetylase family protein [Sphingomonas sp.]|uniref:polysaccharide deacetylase family protein n=1 Tax=Sphingomonas sp. TaxID=28214 RepID=UPI0035BBD0BB
MTARTHPYRVPAARDDERVVWPAPFGTRFIVFVDVEEEFDWRRPLSRENRGTTAMAAFPDAHRRFADEGVALACMVDHPVAADARAVDMLRRAVEDGRSSIGAQLHAWVTPPFDEALTPANTYPGNLPPALEAAKLDTMTAALIAAFGRAPLAYRAGRYGIGPHTLPLLAARGYRIDTSMRARYDYRADGGPDFGAIGNVAFVREGMIELPLTTVYTGAARRFGPRLHAAAGTIRHARGVLARTGLLSRVALTPEDMPIADAREAVSVAAGEGTRLLVLSFHSPSLAPGHTPYVRDAADLAQFHGWWTAMFAHLRHHGIAPATLDEVLAAAAG